MKPVKITTENPELADRFDRVLGDTVEAMEDSGIPYVFIGGIASGGLGRPRSTHDIDLFVRPEDAELTLRALAKKGFRTEKTDPVWLYKGFKENILVDVIFKSKGEIYLDTELLQRSIRAEFHGRELRLVAPEDLIIIKAMAHSEVCPGHWHDALALLAHAQLNWEYLIRRSRRAPRRILSLLLYAQSNDIWVPKNIVDQLYLVVFGDMPPADAHKHASHTTGSPLPLAIPPGGARSTNSGGSAQALPPSHSANAPQGMVAASQRSPLKMVAAERRETYCIGHLREHLAEDPRTNELDIQIEQSNGVILLRGEVLTLERKESVSAIAREMFPELEIQNQIRVSVFVEPAETEEFK